MSLRRNTNPMKPNAIDLFCGGGGLTVGLKKAGFNVIAGVEIDENACNTFVANHPEVTLFQQNIADIKGSDISKKTGVNKIDLLTGCPPCQGFSSLTNKYKEQDKRNELIFEMLRLAKELNPKMIMLENVSGLSKGFKGKALFQKFINQIKKLDYKIKNQVFEVADFGVPQYRKRLVMFAVKNENLTLPKPTHQGNHIPVSEVLKRFNKTQPHLFAEAKKKGVLNKVNWHVIRDMSAINKERLKHAKQGKSWVDIPKELRPKCHQNKKTGFSNVYGRMDASKPAPTITRGCTSLSMGRFGHPTELRTISVREAASIQTFPEYYKFPLTTIESACKIIGNALPCLFAEKMANHCMKYISAYLEPKTI